MLKTQLIMKELLLPLAKKKFNSIQFDEAINSNKNARFICYIHVIDRLKVIEELLFCQFFFFF